MNIGEGACPGRQQNERDTHAHVKCVTISVTARGDARLLSLLLNFPLSLPGG
jgi:hypothetical protein